MDSKLATSEVLKQGLAKKTMAVDMVAIHCAVGQAPAWNIVKYLSGTPYSCTYAVGNDGSIAQGALEDERTVCTSSYEIDNRAITIEVASENYHPYAVTPAAYTALIKLLVDICRRHPKLQAGLRWRADKSLVGKPEKQNMAVHRWFANKVCPGDWLYSRHGEIAESVNALLNAPPVAPSDENPKGGDDIFYRVKKDGKQLGAFALRRSAEAFAAQKGGQVYKVVNGVEVIDTADPQPITPNRLITIASGAQGEHVRALQNLLIWRGYSPGGADGIFGGLTFAALRTFQSFKGLDATGICETSTWNKLLEG